MLDLGGIDIEEIATALADQTDYEHRWLVDPRTGEVVFSVVPVETVSRWLRRTRSYRHATQ